MSLNSNAAQPVLPHQLPHDTNVFTVHPPSTPDVANPSEPALANRAATNSSTEMVNEVNQPSTLIVEHSAPEKSNRSSSASSEAESVNTDDEIKALIKAAERGGAKAQFKLGVCYDKGDGLDKNKEKALEWFHKAAERGYSKAQYTEGIRYSNGEGVAKDKEKAFEWFHRAAEQGYSKAQFVVGMRYRNGEGVAKDKEKAFEWFHRAAEQGYSKAQCNLGLMYSNGEGVAKDKEKAFEWFHKAAEQGYSKAQFNLGMMYDDGHGVEVNKQKAFLWYQKAAMNGDLDAKINLGLLYEAGEGVEKNEEKAFALFFEGAEQDDLDAQYRVAEMYVEGRGVKADKEKGFVWFHKAAEQGNSDAQYYLSKAYREGVDVVQNLPQAAYWMLRFSLAGRDPTLSPFNDHELIKFIPSVLAKYPEFQKKIIRLSAGKFLTNDYIKAIAEFIRINSNGKRLVIRSRGSSISDDRAVDIETALKFNTQLTKLTFYGAKPSKRSTSHLESLLLQNRNIVKLRKYVKDHPLWHSAGFLIDIVPIIVDQMIIAYLKGGHTKKFTQKAIDEFLVSVSVMSLQVVSKT